MHNEPNAMPHRQFYIPLSVFFALVGTYLVLLVAALWFGWQVLTLLLMLADLAIAVCVTLLPVIILIAGYKPEYREQIGTVLLEAGTLLILHFVVLAISVESLLRQPFVLDPHPFDSIIIDTLNWTVPSAIMGLLLGGAFRAKTPRSPFYWVGTLLTAGGCAAFVWYGHYFFSLLGTSLAEIVWWL